MSIATLVPDHLFTTHVWAGFDCQAACTCGKRFKWLTREEDHLRHVLDVVWSDGQAQPNRTSPYKETL